MQMSKENISENGKKLKKLFGSNINVITLIVLIIVFFCMNPSFLGSFNMKNLIVSLGPLLVMSCGASYVRCIGSLDLSMGAVCSCANVLLVSMFPNMGAGAYIVAAVFGVATGLLLGVIVAKLKVPSFIASLGMMNVYECTALLITSSPFSVAQEYRHYIDWGNETIFEIISVLTVIGIVIMIIMGIVQRYTPIGRSLNMIGANERAARISGIAVDKAKIFAFTVCGLTSALAGIMLAIRLKSCDPATGDSYTLLAVAAGLLGGASVSGGKGNMTMTLVGVAMVVVIQNGMTIIGVDAFWDQIVFGALIVLAMVLTSDRSRKDAVVK